VENTIVLHVAGKALVTLISGGQPVILVRNGRPATVVMDVDSYEEAEVASRQAPERGSIHAVSRRAVMLGSCQDLRDGAIIMRTYA
jgi:hypothetical protein